MYGYNDQINNMSIYEQQDGSYIDTTISPCSIPRMNQMIEAIEEAHVEHFLITIYKSILNFQNTPKSAIKEASAAVNMKAYFFCDGECDDHGNAVTRLCEILGHKYVIISTNMKTKDKVVMFDHVMANGEVIHHLVIDQSFLFDEMDIKTKVNVFMEIVSTIVMGSLNIYVNDTIVHYTLQYIMAMQYIKDISSSISDLDKKFQELSILEGIDNVCEVMRNLHKDLFPTGLDIYSLCLTKLQNGDNIIIDLLCNYGIYSLVGDNNVGNNTSNNS